VTVILSHPVLCSVFDVICLSGCSIFSDSDSDSNEGESKKPGFAYAKIRHMGTVNRIRVGSLSII